MAKLSTKMMAERAKVSRSVLRGWIVSGKLPAERVQQKTRWYYQMNEGAFNKWLKVHNRKRMVNNGMNEYNGFHEIVPSKFKNLPRVAKSAKVPGIGRFVKRYSGGASNQTSVYRHGVQPGTSNGSRDTGY